MPVASPDLPWSIRFLLFILFKFNSAFLCRSNGTVNRFLANLVDFKAPPTKKPDINGVTTHDITVDPSRNLWFRLYIPYNNEASTTEISLPIIVYFHGGGFAFYAADSKVYDYFCKRLAHKLPAIIVSVNYRLAPEHPFPSAYDDGFDVLKFLDDRYRFDFGCVPVPMKADSSRCFLAGDSAGGNLAHHVALKVAEEENSRFTELKVIGIIAIQPFFGGEERTESEIRLARAPVLNVNLTDWFWKAFLPTGLDRDHTVVNVFGPKSKNISSLKFPATVVFVGGCDPLQDWQKRYYGGLKKSGKEVYLIEYPNAIHSFYIFPNIPETSLLIDDIKSFLKKQTGVAQL